MAKTKDSVVVELRAENAKLKGDLNKAKGAVKGFGTSATAAFAKLGVAAAAAFGTAKIISFVKGGITEFAKFEDAMDRLTSKVNAVGGGFEGMEGQLESYIRQTQEATRFSKVELAGALDSLVLKTGDYNKALTLNEKAMDLSVMANIPLRQAADLLAKATEGSVGAIGSLGMMLGMSARASMNTEKVLGELELQMDGMARSEEGLTVEMAKLNNAMSEGAELVGKEVGPAVIKFAQFLVGVFTESVRFVINLFKTWWVQLKMIGRVIDEVLGPVLDWIAEKARLVADKIVRAWTWLTGKIRQATKKISDAAGKSNNKIVQIFKDGAAELKEIWTTSDEERAALDAIAAARNTKLQADNVLGNMTTEEMITLAKRAAIDARMTEMQGYYNWLFARDEEDVKRARLSAKTKQSMYEEMAKGMSDAMTLFFEQTIAGGESIVEAFKAFAKGMFKAIVNAVGSALIKEGAAYVARGIAALLGIVTAAAAAPLLAAGAKLVAAGGVIKAGTLALAEGGIVTQPTMALVGEAGPEAVIPLDRAGLLGGPVTIEVLNMQFPDVRNAADVQDARFSQSVARQLATGLQEVRRRMGVR